MNYVRFRSKLHTTASNGITLNHMTNERTTPFAGNDSASSFTGADHAVAALHHIDDAVNAMRKQRMNDPDSLGDKILKFALPSLAAIVAGKLFQAVWNKGIAHRHTRRGLSADAPQGMLMSIIFAAASAAFGAVISQLSNHGSQALVDKRHALRH